MQKYVDDYYCMRSSHDSDLAEPFIPGCGGLGHFHCAGCLGAFDSRESISRMLLGKFPNELCVLIQDVAATLVDFHDIIMSNLCATPGMAGLTDHD